MKSLIIGHKSKFGQKHQFCSWSFLTAFLLALLLAPGAWATNAALSGFEIEGDILVGGTAPPEAVAPVTSPPFSQTGADVDWAGEDSDDEDCLGSVCAALTFHNAATDCDTGVTVCDNPNEPGDAEFFQDGLKSEGDLTTFTQGDKENDWTNQSPVDAGDPTGTQQSETPWHIVPGSVQPNKDDLFNTYAYSLIQGAQADVVLGFERTNNNGSSHVDFELNQKPWVNCAFQPGGYVPTGPDDPNAQKCPLRVEGDILISYEITVGGAVSNVSFFKWNLPGGDSIDGQVNCTGYLAPGGNQTAPCPWQEVTFDPNDVFSTLNPVPIEAGGWGSKLPDGTPTDMIGEFGFFETFLDFDELGFGPGCPGFATVSLKSRSSGSSVTSALSDLSGPSPLDLNNCAQITIVKDATPADGTDFQFDPSNNFDPVNNAAANFKLDDSADSDTGLTNLSDTKVFTQLVPSTVSGFNFTVEELIPSGWDLQSVSCVDDDGGTFVGSTDKDATAGNPQATITLQPEQDVTCTFTNQGKGSIKIIKQTDPDGASGSFSFSGKDPENGDLAWGSLVDNGSTTISDLVAGTYTAIEADPSPAFDLTNIVCEGDISGGTDSTTDKPNRTATFNLDPGENLVCTFTNTQRGSITIDKETVGGVGSFDYTAAEPDGGTDIPNFSRDTDSGGNPTNSSAYTNLLPGKTYNITETVPSGWDATNLVCSGDTNSTVTPDTTNYDDVSIVLAPGENISCTFTNTKRGSIKIDKQTVGGVGSFDYTAAEPDGGTDIPNFSRDTDSGGNPTNSAAYTNLLPGKTYNITETVPSGWDATNLVCSGDTNSTVTPDTTNFDDVSIVLAAGENISCTFTNTKRGTIIVEKQTNPDGASGSFDFSGSIAGLTGTIGDGGQITVNNLLPGTYTATEADPTSAGFKLESISCDDGLSTTASSGVVGTRTATFELDPGETVKCTFTNSTGAIKVTKTAKDYSQGGVVAQSGVSFGAAATGYPGGSGSTNSSGEVCFDHLVPGIEYTVTETVPSGYQAAGDNPKTKTVTAGATCSIGTPDTLSFVNDPLSQIQVIFSSLAGPGVTAASIVCADGSGPVAAVAENGSADPALDDSNETFTNLKEGTYTCTIVIDP